MYNPPDPGPSSALAVTSRLRHRSKLASLRENMAIILPAMTADASIRPLLAGLTLNICRGLTPTGTVSFRNPDIIHIAEFQGPP